MSDDLLTVVTDALRMAPYDMSYWTPALQAAAAFCGASSAQVLAYSQTRTPMLLTPGFDADDTAAYVALGGTDPAVNIGMAYMTDPRLPLLRPCGDQEYLSEEQRRLDPLYNEFFAPRGGAYNSAGALIRGPALSANLSFMRPSALDAAGRETMARIMPLFARACALQFELETQRAALLTRAFDALTEAVLICDTSGWLLGASRAGEALLREGRFILARQGRLTCLRPEDEARLESLVSDCTRPMSLTDHALSRRGGGLGGAMVIRQEGGRPARIDVAPAPDLHGPATLRPLALIRIRQSAPLGRLNLEQLGKAFSLTPAESEVAEAMAMGLSAQQIAEKRGVSVLTTHTQERAVLAKIQCQRRSELPLLLAPFSLH